MALPVDLQAAPARAANGHAAAAPPSSVMKSRRLTSTISSPPSGISSPSHPAPAETSGRSRCPE
jgi:hypothetical protein